MEVYEKIKKDVFNLLVIVVISGLVISYFDLGIDDSDSDGFNRSDMQLLTDYGTGMQYLYKGGSLIKRVDVDGNHIKVD